jgi:hypothetical protein
MRPDGKLVVDIHALLSSKRVQDDLGVMRRKLSEADAKRAKESRQDGTAAVR